MTLVGAAISLSGMPPLATAVRPEWRHLTPWSASSAELLLVIGIALAAFGALMWVPGLLLYVLVPSFSKSARQSQEYGSHRVVLACTLLATLAGNLLAALLFVPMVLLMASGADAPDLSARVLSPLGIAIAAVSLDVALLATVYLRIVRPGEIPWATMGLDFRHAGSRLFLGLLFGIALFVASSLVEFVLSLFGIQQTRNVIFESVRRASPREFGLILLAGAVIAPIVEEIYFRGYVFRAYLDHKGPALAFLFSAGLFAVVHTDLPAFLPIFAMGLLLSYFYHRTGSIVPSIVAHAFNNAAAFTLLYLGLG